MEGAVLNRAIVIALATSAAACGEAGQVSQDLGAQQLQDLATPHAGDLALQIADDLAAGAGDDLAELADLAQPAQTIDMATPPDMALMCPLVPACDAQHLPCCNGGSCINGNCWSTSGQPCNNVTGPLCWNNGLGGSTNNGVCGVDGKCQ